MLVMTYLSLCLSRNALMSLSLLKDSWQDREILSDSFSFSTLDI